MISNDIGILPVSWIKSNAVGIFPLFLKINPMSNFLIVRKGAKFINVSVRQSSAEYLPLLYSLLIVSVSGALKLRFAYTFLGMQIPASHFVAAALITFAAYAFDRGIENKEDDRRSERQKQVLIGCAVLCILISIILFPNPALLLPFLIAFFYTKGVSGFRLKGGFGIKNCVVAFTFALGMMIFIGVFSFPALLVYLFFFSKSFINTIIYDVRDVQKDTAAGISTIPAVLKPFQLLMLLLAISCCAHFLLIAGYLKGIFTGGGVLILSSIHSTVYILLYTGRCGVLRNTLVDGEWIWYTCYTILRDWLL